MEWTDMCRFASGLFGQGTVNTKTLSIAFLEFLEDGDSNDLKSLWLSYGFRDISPLWGHQSRVPSFKDNPALIRRWPEFQREMMSCEADWYYISGHHGREFKVQGKQDSALYHYNSQKSTGFFNEPYHHGPWTYGSDDNPTAHASANDVYMSMTTDGPGCEGPDPQDNPLYTSPHNDCMGVFLIGCNSMVYHYVRLKLVKYFPNALIIGLMGKEGAAMKKTQRVIQEYGREFFTDPDSIDAEELIHKLNPNRFAGDKMGVIQHGKMHFIVKGKYYSCPATEPIRGYMLTGDDPPVIDDATSAEQEVYG